MASSRKIFSLVASALLALSVASHAALINTENLDPALQGLAPADVPTQVQRFLTQGRNAEALTLAEAGLRHNDKNLNLRFMRTVALQNLGRVDEAITDLRRMTGDFPEVPEPYNNLAVILAQRGEMDEAEGLLKRALQVSPQFATARKNLGDIYLTKAYNEYREAHEVIKNNAQLNERLEALGPWFANAAQVEPTEEKSATSSKNENAAEAVRSELENSDSNATDTQKNVESSVTNPAIRVTVTPAKTSTSTDEKPFNSDWDSASQQ